MCCVYGIGISPYIRISRMRFRLGRLDRARTGAAGPTWSNLGQPPIFDLRLDRLVNSQPPAPRAHPSGPPAHAVEDGPDTGLRCPVVAVERYFKTFAQNL